MGNADRSSGAYARPGNDKISTVPAQRFVALDALRGIAALIIIGIHYDWYAWPEITSQTLIGRSGGYLGVDFFLILSGFVLAHAFYEKASPDLWTFFKKRIFRFWPLHIVTLLATVALMIATSEPINGEGLLLNVLMLHSLGYGDWELSFNLPSWTLSVELAVNMLFGALILLVPNRRLNGALMLLISLVSGAILVVFLRELDANKGNVLGILNLGLLRGMLDFPLGILAYRLFAAHQSWLTRTSLLHTLFVGLLLTLFLAVLFLPGHGRRDFAYLGIFVLLVLFAANPGPFWIRVLSPLRFLGDISFAVYLIHCVIIRTMLLFWPHPSDYVTGLFIVYALTIALSALVHYRFERPAYDWLVARWARKPRPRALQQPAE